jgi:hypothetical protein
MKFYKPVGIVEKTGFESSSNVAIEDNYRTKCFMDTISTGRQLPINQSSWPGSASFIPFTQYVNLKYKVLSDQCWGSESGRVRNFSEQYFRTGFPILTSKVIIIFRNYFEGRNESFRFHNIVKETLKTSWYSDKCSECYSISVFYDISIWPGYVVRYGTRYLL